MNIRRNTRRSHAEIFTGALNDILFILLLFFLIVSTLANPNVIKLSQPKAKSNTKVKQTVVVSIDKSFQYYVATKKVAIEDLEEEIKPFIAKELSSNAAIIINADKTVPIDYVVAVMRVANELGVRTALAVKDKQ